MLSPGLRLELKRGGGGGARDAAPAARRARSEVPSRPKTENNYKQTNSDPLFYYTSQYFFRGFRK